MKKTLNISNFTPDGEQDKDCNEPVTFDPDGDGAPASYEGSSICLFRLIECEECGFYIIEPKGDDSCSKATINLGRGRKLSVNTNSVLALIYPDRVKFRYLPLEAGDELALIPHLKNLGLKAKAATGIFEGHQVSIRRKTWEEALDYYYGIFTGNGFAITYRGWFDCHTFSMFVYYKAPVLYVDGQEVSQIKVHYIGRDFSDKVMETVKESLLGEHNKTSREIKELVTELGYEEEYHYLKLLDKNGELIKKE